MPLGDFTVAPETDPAAVLSQRCARRVGQAAAGHA
jgi:hypothetical protein